MYVKIGKYGQPAQNQHGQIAGSVNVEMLPSTNNPQHVELRIEESKILGAWPEPMLIISINQQTERMYAVSTILKALDIMDQNELSGSIQGIHEPGGEDGL
jgi:hypothetical protein